MPTRHARPALVLRRTPAPLAAVALALLLASCAPPPPAPPATPDPPIPAATATPRPTPTPTASATDPFALACDDLLTRAQVEAALNPDAQSLGDQTSPEGWGRGTAFPELQALIDPAESTNCTWVVPASDGAFTVSVVRADAAVQSAVTTRLTGLPTTVDGDVTTIEITSYDAISSTEVHKLSATRGLWVCVFSTAGPARDLADAIWARVTS